MELVADLSQASRARSNEYQQHTLWSVYTEWSKMIDTKIIKYLWHVNKFKNKNGENKR